MASTADFRNGMVLKIDGHLQSIAYFQHVKPGKGPAFVRTKLKNVLTGRVVEKTFRAGEKVEDVRLERRPVSYSYSDGQLYHFMDQNTFEMIPVSGELIGDDQLKRSFAVILTIIRKDFNPQETDIVVPRDT